MRSGTCTREQVSIYTPGRVQTRHLNVSPCQSAETASAMSYLQAPGKPQSQYRMRFLSVAQLHQALSFQILHLSIQTQRTQNCSSLLPQRWPDSLFLIECIESGDFRCEPSEPQLYPGLIKPVGVIRKYLFGKTRV